MLRQRVALIFARPSASCKVTDIKKTFVNVEYSEFLLKVVFDHVSGFCGDVLLVEVELVVVCLQGGVVVLLFFHDSLEVVPLGLALLVEFFADLDVGVW